MFYFTTLDELTSVNVLTVPIWQQVGRDMLIPLIEI